LYESNIYVGDSLRNASRGTVYRYIVDGAMSQMIYVNVKMDFMDVIQSKCR